MIKKIFLSIAAIAALAALPACTKNSELLESTTTVAEAELETVARSADGLFELILPAGAIDAGTKIRIDTRRDLRAEDTVGQVYVIAGTNLTLHVPGQVRMYIPTGATAQTYEMALIDLDRATRESIFGSRYVEASGHVRAPFNSFPQAGFVLVAAPYQPCYATACGQTCTTCAPNDPSCSGGGGFCDNSGACVPQATTCLPADGFNDPPGSGRAFALNFLGIAEGSVLSPLAELMNDQIRQSLLGGESLILIELSGLSETYRGEDASTTVKIYGVNDADDPFFPANNFKIPPGETTCCEFTVKADQVDRNGHGFSRMPAQISGGELVANGDVRFGVTPFPLGAWGARVHQLRLTLPSDLSALRDGWFTGAFRVFDLAWMDNPYCYTLNPRCPVQFGTRSSMLDLITVMVPHQPDMDLDNDGLERIEDSDGNGMIDRCWDGCLGNCTPELVPPVDPRDPGSCALDLRMADGYSINMSFTAMPARVVGVDSLRRLPELELFHPIDGVVYGRASTYLFIWPGLVRVLIEARAPNAAPGDAPKRTIIAYSEQEEWEDNYNFALDGVEPGDEVTFRFLSRTDDDPALPSATAIVPQIPAATGELIAFPAAARVSIGDHNEDGAYSVSILQSDGMLDGALFTVENLRTAERVRVLIGRTTTLLIAAQPGDTLSLSLCYRDGRCTVDSTKPVL